ncbi:MAG: FAD-binding oxidoreductase [Oligoflexia bacterium]|nr:FAD-binding oxidoreductase [Oligoflexia bacterium]
MSKDLKKFEHIIIGSGISGLCCALELTERSLELGERAEIAIISSSQLIPCSLRTTSSVALQGIQKGLSALGDLLFNSYKTFTKSYDFYQFKSIEKVKRLHFSYDENSKEKLKNRHGRIDSFNFNSKNYEGVCEDGYVISPEHFHLELIDLLKERGVTFIDDLVVGLDKNEKLITGKAGLYQYNKLVLASGAYTILLPVLKSKKDDLRRVKGSEVPGHYYEWDFQYPSSFILTIDGHNLCYRHFDKKLVLGGSTEKDRVSLLREDQLKKMYEGFGQYLDLPSIDQAKKLTGLRQKGVKRTPYIGEIETDIFALTSLYKNGFSVSFEGAKILADKILN